MHDSNELRAAMAQFNNGTNDYWKHALNPKVTYTDGVRFFAQNAGDGAYWMLDILVTEPKILHEVQTYGIVFVTLKAKKNQARLVVTDGGKNGEADAVVYSRKFDITDCPDGDWKFFMEDMVIMLPSER